MPTYDHPRPAVTTDIILLDRRTKPSQILLIQRKKDPFGGHWAFPGGFIDEDEDPLHAAARELAEETSLRDLPLEPFRFYGKPGRDPRGHCISCVFFTFATPESIQPKAEDDAAAVEWWPLSSLPPLAFDHHQILHEFVLSRGARSS